MTPGQAALTALHLRQLYRLKAQLTAGLSLITVGSPAEAEAVAAAWAALSDLGRALDGLQALQDKAQARAGGQAARAAAEAGGRPAGPRGIKRASHD